MSKQNANAVAITGGTISGITPLDLAAGGTGSGNAAGARTNLQLGNIAVMNTSNVAFTGGTMDSVFVTGGEITGLVTPLAVADGGTSGNTQATARTGLGLGTMAVQNANNVAITGGSITGLSSTIGIADGGTGASTAAGARTNLGLGSISTQSSTAVAITGGSATGLTNLGASNVAITGGSITGITALPVTSGGTGNSTAAGARTNLGAAASATSIIAGAGLSGGGTLTSDVILSIASNSNGYGTRYISTSAPTGGNDGDIWYQI
jgi:hypothetical protein